jgi:dihydroneopterin aldolase
MIIKLNDMLFYGFHGVHDEERRLGQRFIVSAHLYTPGEHDSKISRLEDTVDYTKVYDDIREVLESRQFQLLEVCANTIAEKLLEDYPLLHQVRLFIQKPSVPIKGILSSVEVEIFKERT